MQHHWIEHGLGRAIRGMARQIGLIEAIDERLATVEVPSPLS